MGRSVSENSTNVRFSLTDAWWSWLSDWTVGEIATPSFDEPAPCPACGEGAVTRAGRCEQCALEYELFHREQRGLALDAR